MHLPQGVNASLTVATRASSGTRPSTASRARNTSSRTIRARPLTRSVSTLPGNKEQQPDVRVLRHVDEGVAAAISGAIGDRQRLVVERTPLCYASIRSDASPDATTTSGAAAISAPQLLSSRATVLRATRSVGMRRTPSPARYSALVFAPP